MEPPWSSIINAPHWCLPDYADVRSTLLRPLAPPTINCDSSNGLVTLGTNGQLSSHDGSTKDFGKEQIMNLRPGMPSPGSVRDIPFALVAVEVLSSWTGNMHNLIGQPLGKGVLVVVLGEAVNVKSLVDGMHVMVQDEVTIVNILLYNASRKVASYRAAENVLCISSGDGVPGRKFPRYLRYVEATWAGSLPVEVVGYLSLRLKTEKCNLYWSLVADLDPRLLARIPSAPRQACNVVVGYLGHPESMQHRFAVTLTARIKDADSGATVLREEVLADFIAGIQADVTSTR